jgi:hypothetical protein
LLYQSKDELEISKLNERLLIISQKTTHETFILNLEKEGQKKLLIKDYFYRLTALNQKVLLGKPLFLNQKYEDYSLPLSFIF